MPLYSTAQVTIYDEEKFLEFTLQFPPDTTSATQIDWGKEKLVSEFIMKGEVPLKYLIALKNDTIAALSKYADGRWEFQEDIAYTDWAVRRVDGTKVISEFKITDFDNDGDEDLTCWTFTNINGNMWTIIFLNDQENQKLVSLYNTADQTLIWDRPEYDNTTGVINCTLDGSAYGASEESSFKLNYLTPIPLLKERQERYDPKYIEDFYYKGEKGKWKLVKHTKHK